MGERININRLVASPEKQSERPFDPERDLQPEHKSRIKSWIEADFFDRFDVHMRIQLSKIFNIERVLSEAEQRRIEQMRESRLEDGAIDEVLAIDARLAVINSPPMRRGYSMKDVENSVRLSLEGSLGRISIAEHARLAGFNIRLTNKEESKINETVHEIRSTASDSDWSDAWVTLAQICRQARLFNLDPKLTAADWAGFNRTLIRHVESASITGALGLMCDMHILSADKIIIPEGGGFELIFNNGGEPTDEDSPTVPERRKF